MTRRWLIEWLACSAAVIVVVNVLAVLLHAAAWQTVAASFGVAFCAGTGLARRHKDQL